MASFRLARFALFVLLGTVPVVAQVGTGFLPLTSKQRGSFDSVDLATLNVHFDIPVLQKVGRGIPFNYVLSFDSNIWSRGTYHWLPVTNFGWRGITEANLGWVSYTSTPNWPCDDPTLNTTVYNNFAYHDPQGGVHSFGQLSSDQRACLSGDILSQVAQDGSGYVMTISPRGPGSTVYPRSGGSITPPLGAPTASGTVVDRNGNQVNTDGTHFYDTMSSTTPVLTVTGASPNPVYYTYTAPNNQSVSFKMTFQQYTVSTNFNCTNVTNFPPTAEYLVNAIILPDNTQYSFTYDSSGRIRSVTLPLPNNPQITYSYSGGTNGEECDGSTAALTRTTPDGTWTYVRSGSGGQITTITDPLANQTVVTFYAGYEVQRTIYQGTCCSTPLKTVYTCYNNTAYPCSTTHFGLPIYEVTTTTQDASNGQTQEKVALDTFTDQFGTETYGLPVEIDESDYAIGQPGGWLRKTFINYASLGNNTQDKPYQVTIQDGSGNTFSQTTYSYDQYNLQPSNAPQHTNPSGARGNPTTITYLVNPGSLSKTFYYYDSGTAYQTIDFNGTQGTYTYTYGDCGATFVTEIQMPLGLSRSMTWNCTGGVPASSTDENHQTTSIAWNDSYFWRPASSTDPLNNQTTFRYNSAVDSEAYMTFSGGASITDNRTTVDWAGRVHIQQREQAPGSAYYDTVETDYDALGRLKRVTLPYSGQVEGTVSTYPSICYTYDTTLCPSAQAYDALGRPQKITDSGGGSISYAYNKNDVLLTISGGQSFQKQFEYDGLGRLTSVCEISTTLRGVGQCGQSNAQYSGYWTKYTYDPLGRLTGVIQNAQPNGHPQTRSYSYDRLGRMTSETNPESGTWNYVYDTNPSNANYNSPGDMVQRTDAAGNVTNYIYDSLHRNTDAGVQPWGLYTGPLTNPVCRRFRYDTQSTPPQGVTVAYTMGRLELGQTDDCGKGGGSWHPITDEWFSYDALGRRTDTYQQSPSSNGYFHISETYFPNGALATLSIPTLPSFTYTVDSEGRVKTINANSGINPLSNVGYSVAGLPTVVTMGDGDSDNYTYDPNTNRMTQYQFNIGGKTNTGTLVWNPNATLSTLNIVDQWDSNDTQKCTFAYDDLSRVTTDNCGSVWSQTFTYDAYGNLSKSGSSSWQPGYDNNNHYQWPGQQYDLNGNPLNDSINYSYTWDPNWGTLASVNGTPETADAFGRFVEGNSGVREVYYGPDGFPLAVAVNGTSIVRAFIKMPGGSQAIYNMYSDHGLSYFRHADWLGSARGTSTPSNSGGGNSYAAFGEQYATTGTDNDYEGTTAEEGYSLYDFLYREYSIPAGRFLNPDPAGMAAVYPSNPESWNRYAYVANRPLMLTDSFGLAPPYFCTNRGELVCHGNGEIVSGGELAILSAALQGEWIKGGCLLNCDGPRAGQPNALDWVYWGYPRLGLLDTLGMYNYMTYYAAYARGVRSEQQRPATALEFAQAIAGGLANLPTLCNPGIGATAKIGPFGANVDVNQQGEEAKPSLELRGLSISSAHDVSVNVGEGVGATVSGDPVNHLVTSVGVFAGVTSGLLELNANAHAQVVGAFQCPD